MVGVLLRLRTHLASGRDLVILSVFHHCRELSVPGAGGEVKTTAAWLTSYQSKLD
jgi:hypothetical protein